MRAQRLKQVVKVAEQLVYVAALQCDVVGFRPSNPAANELSIPGTPVVAADLTVSDAEA